ncbi:MAG: poly-gamma-glutamate hydrolase family protein [Longimicrobiales bacterium]
MTDTYRCFRELQESEREGEDWALERVDRGSRILLLAPHGGWIEPLTTELAKAIAGAEFSFYSFVGLKSGGNERLHLTSHRFDEPLALEAVARADRVLAIHGERSRHGAFVMVGGRWDEMRAALCSALRGAGFRVLEPREGLGGRHRRNICNRGRLGGGGQLELSEGLRRQLREEAAVQEAFVSTVRGVVRVFEAASWKASGGDTGGGSKTRNGLPPDATDQGGDP